MDKQKISEISSNSVPEELKRQNQWLCYRIEWDSSAERDQKCPKAPHWSPTGKQLVTTGTASQKQWADYETAQEFVEVTNRSLPDDKALDGVGFVFTPDDPYVGIDLDDCVSAEGNISEPARDIAATMNSYTEVSQSGTGLHIIGRAPNGLDPSHKQKDTNLGIEFYDKNQYFATTGERVTGLPEQITKSGDEFQTLQKEYNDPRCNRTESVSSPNSFDSTNVSSRQVVRTAEDYGKREFRDLYEGRTLHKSKSESDAAFFIHCFFWCKGDRDLVEQVIWDSDRPRPKWDDPRGQSTWLEWELDSAERIQNDIFEGDYGEYADI